MWCNFQSLTSLLHIFLQAVTNLLNNESVSDIDRLHLVMLYALRYEKESPVQLMQLFNKLASQSPKYKPGVIYLTRILLNSCTSLKPCCINLG
jgi:hypothetical protein